MADEIVVVEVSSPEESKGKNLGEKQQVNDLSLHSEWTFWYDQSKSSKKTEKEDSFDEVVVKLGSFNDIKGFWSHYTHIAKPEALPSGANLRLFRGTILPSWENFAEGGCWIVRFSKSIRPNQIWEELVFSAIGERFEDDAIAGVVISRRKMDDYVSVWVKDNNLRFRVGEKMKQILNLDVNAHIEYKFNSLSIRDRSTSRNSKVYSLP